MGHEREKLTGETVYAVPEFWVQVYSGHDSLYGYRRYSASEAAERIAADDHPDYTTFKRATWKQRELLEAQAGRAGTPPVWEDQPWWCVNAEIWQDHHLTASIETPGMVAFYPNAEKASLGLKTRVRPGRYLSKFFADILSEKDRARMAKWQETGSIECSYDDEKLYPLDFANTASEIERVYVDGPHSCMSHAAGSFDTEGTHPATVYAAGDLAVAYLSDANEKVRARSLCRPDRKVFGRVYPTPSDYWRTDGFASEADAEAMQNALRNRLLAMGWQVSSDYGTPSFQGAKIRRIEIDDGNKVVMPWMDNDWKVDDHGDYFTMSQDGDFKPDNTDGTLEMDSSARCDRCEESIRGDGGMIYTSVRSSGGRNEETWCEGCRDDNTFECTGFQEFFSDDVDHVTIEGDLYTVVYAEENFSRSDRSGDYFTGASVDMADGDVWSQDEFDRHGFTCAITEENYAQSERHPDHREIHQDCTDEEIAKWLGEGAPDAPTIPISSNTGIPSKGTIVDDTQTELELENA